MAYFSNLCDDYRNTDEVMPDEIIAEYDRLTPFFEKTPLPPSTRASSTPHSD